MLEAGTPAPPFQLPDHDGERVALRDLRGRWVVLYFYPRDDTPGCTVEACEFTAALPALRALDAVVYGCSADPAAAHQKFRAKHRLGVGLLTDADHAVMTAYGAWGKKVLYGRESEGVIRSTVLIAPDGRIAHHWPNVRAAGHAEQVRARLAELQGWAPGAAADEAAPAAKVRPKAAAPAARASANPKVATKPRPRATAETKAKPKPSAKPQARLVAKVAAPRRPRAAAGTRRPRSGS